MASDSDSLELDLVTASLRADQSDLAAFVESLAVKLEDVIPAHVQVQRRRSGLRGPKLVRRIAVDAGDQRLELDAAGGSVQTRSARLSAGIVLKNEEIGIEQWLELLGRALAAEAQRNQQTRQALERLLLR